MTLFRTCNEERRSGKLWTRLSLQQGVSAEPWGEIHKEIDPFSKTDLKCFLSSVYDLRTSEKKGFARIIFLSSSFYLHLGKGSSASFLFFYFLNKTKSIIVFPKMLIKYISNQKKDKTVMLNNWLTHNICDLCLKEKLKLTEKKIWTLSVLSIKWGCSASCGHNENYNNTDPNKNTSLQMEKVT